MQIKFAVVAGLIALASAGAAIGQEDPIAARKALMKGNGAAAKTAVEMIQGKTAYDPAAAAAAMKSLQEALTKFPTLFPEGSDTGDTKASPEIWKNMDDFKAIAAKLVTDAKAAETAAAGGLDAFKAAFATVGGDCQSCHQKYRLQ